LESHHFCSIVTDPVDAPVMSQLYLRIKKNGYLLFNSLFEDRMIKMKNHVPMRAPALTQEGQ